MSLKGGGGSVPGGSGGPLNLTGATAATRYAGGTASGAPVSGTFEVGDFVVDESGHVWVCTVAGSPGTWANVGASAGVSSFNSRTGPVVPVSGDYTVAEVTGAAPLASPALTGTPTAPTAAALTDDTQVATTAYTDAAVAVEKTRAEAAEALKAPLASPALTGTPTAPTAAGGTNTTQVATTAFVETAVSAATEIDGVTVSGTPSSGQVLTATSATAADWQTPTSGSMANPMTTADDMIVGGASGTPERLGIGSNGDVLTVVSGAPAWQTPSGTSAPSGPGGTAGADTGSAVTIGDPSTFNQWWGVMNAATVTVTMPTAVAGALFQARLDQDATGGRALAFAVNPTFPDYPSATAALAAINAHNAANDHVWITFICVDGSTWEAFPALAPATTTRQTISLAYAATMTPALPDGGQDAIYKVGALTGAGTIANPTGTPQDGQKIEFRFAQDATGGRALTWGSEFTTANTALITWPSEPTTASATWKELYAWNAGTSKWERLAMA